jgi:hypothetical protein
MTTADGLRERYRQVGGGAPALTWPMQVSPVSQMRLATSPSPQQACPTAPQGAHIIGTVPPP